MSAKACLLTILALPVLYVLSVPPIGSAIVWHYFRVEQRTGVRISDPEWLFDYSYPYAWLVMNTSLKEPLNAYSDWWIEAFGMRVRR
ncbi:hypothetical protein AYO49_05950 [Verrucomicrobiaceae bacterium SCGC AG-212-N21]|nr:hypothetical protein AYO49_05950 [Verrucomicrobiaceae bacterium SCGC AG-212-N21]